MELTKAIQRENSDATFMGELCSGPSLLSGWTAATFTSGGVPEAMAQFLEPLIDAARRVQRDPEARLLREAIGMLLNAAANSGDPRRGGVSGRLHGDAEENRTDFAIEGFCQSLRKLQDLIERRRGEEDFIDVEFKALDAPAERSTGLSAQDLEASAGAARSLPPRRRGRNPHGSKQRRRVICHLSRKVKGKRS